MIPVSPPCQPCGFAHKVGQQLRHPHGRLGRLVGLLMRPFNKRPNQLAITALNPDTDDTILELGFGPGDAIAMMVPLVTAGKIYGLEQSQLMLDMATARNRRAVTAGQIHLRRGDFHALPYANEQMNKILAVNVIYFWDQPEAVLRECRRVLRSHGRLVIYATDAETMKHWTFASSRTHHHHNLDSIEFLLKAENFNVCHSARVVVSRYPIVYGLIVVAEKIDPSSA